MNKLNTYREIIDEIDEKIINLYEKRMNVVKDVINFKLENNIPVTDSNREELMLNKNLNKIKDQNLKRYYHFVLEGFLKASKKMQNDIKENM